MTDQDIIHEVLNNAISVQELQLSVYVLIFATSLLLIRDILKDVWVSRANYNWKIFDGSSSILLVPLVALPLATEHAEIQKIESSAIPINSVLSPAIAAAVLRHILHRRREQVQISFVPDLFSDEEEKSLLSIVSMADESDQTNEVEVSVSQHPDVVRVLNAVERPLNNEHHDEIAVGSHSVVIELYGYPIVKNFVGDIAVFRKKKALELLTWLSLNRDKSRRSAARTAMWDVNITDATFSTILSEMRRSLFDLDPTLGNCSPATYTDEIALNCQIVTDSDLLKMAYLQFKNDGGDPQNVLTYLSGIRDVPFAGTSYIWADLDGTTTRLVIQAITTSVDIAHWAIKAADSNALNIAVAAGLRVFPGHEELSEIHSRFLTETVQRGSRSVA